ncbi:hypothetical protein SAMN04488057_103102 [Cyclobacterium lianum]|uniref:Uncharacterized protein n=1 Tax=Cyclobacterium lianum TaxID=388280 RepID=A0A1M7L4U6_9BACT|nr:hypothetical protein [Cyclobacterium lianum]SHM72826.1 hypothetical protein SAMN04488057_103102 [Cyclobacterium lianum]
MKISLKYILLILSFVLISQNKLLIDLDATVEKVFKNGVMAFLEDGTPQHGTGDLKKIFEMPHTKIFVE